MTLVTIPNRPGPSDTRHIADILANFDAITAVMNGHLDSSNFAGGVIPQGRWNYRAGSTTPSTSINANDGDAIYVQTSPFTVNLPSVATSGPGYPLTGSQVRIIPRQSPGPYTIVADAGHQIMRWGYANVTSVVANMGIVDFVYDAVTGVWHVFGDYGNFNDAWQTVTAVTGVTVVQAMQWKQMGSMVSLRGMWTIDAAHGTTTLNIPTLTPARSVSDTYFPTFESATGRINQSRLTWNAVQMAIVPGGSGSNVITVPWVGVSYDTAA